SVSSRKTLWRPAACIFSIIGVGGITNSKDAIEYLMAGATAVSIGAASMVDPCASIEILEGIIAYCSSHGIHRLNDLVGCAH
ncbi:MAG TPA: dihydroorotate dehydrogenase, partial [Spirochaetota bacterium]|nr:dihydroorotate dehydrogenase [Spirochaetota bacterium]